MNVVTFLDVNLDVCPACAGLWVNPDELTAIIHKDSKAFAELESQEIPHVEHGPAGPSAFKCPDDGGFLCQYHYMFNSPVILHNCPNCSGFFVEDGQLAQMQQVIDQNNQPMTPQDEEKLALGQMEAERENFVGRQMWWANMFRVMGRYQPGWWGLL
jgi:Zn-finger nucleic acid-binding protein